MYIHVYIQMCFRWKYPVNQDNPNLQTPVNFEISGHRNVEVLVCDGEGAGEEGGIK